jgi:Cytochrome P450
MAFVLVSIGPCRAGKEQDGHSGSVIIDLERRSRLNETQRHDWDPRNASVLEDQRRAYDEMRERCPVAHSEFMGWSVFRHEDVAAVLADPETYSSASRHPAIPNGMDPPEHGRYRAALAPHFEQQQMARLEPRCRGIAADLLGPMPSGREAEFMEAFATPFTLKTLCFFLGWPEQLWECLGGWTHGNQQAAFTRDPAAGKALAGLFAEHVKANLDAHRASPDDVVDLTDALLSTEVDGQQLDDDQIVSILRNWTAGEGTVAGGLSLLVLHLAQQPDLQQRLRSEPSLIPAAIEEILRFDDPLVANRRTTTREVQIGDRTIPEGENLTLMWIAANRDPRVFDDPDAIRLERDTDRSLVWGQGIHLCAGAPLARLEMRVALEELLSRTRGFELAGEAYRSVYPSDGLAAFTLRLG